MSKPDLVKCSVLGCTDVPRYVWAVVLPWTAEATVLPPAVVDRLAILVRLCGTHNANPHGTPIAEAVRWYVGRCDRALTEPQVDEPIFIFQVRGRP